MHNTDSYRINFVIVTASFVDTKKSSFLPLPHTPKKGNNNRIDMFTASTHSGSIHGQCVVGEDIALEGWFIKSSLLSNGNLVVDKCTQQHTQKNHIRRFIESQRFVRIFGIFPIGSLNCVNSPTVSSIIQKHCIAFPVSQLICYMYCDFM